MWNRFLLHMMWRDIVMNDSAWTVEGNRIRQPGCCPFCRGIKSMDKKTVRSLKCTKMTHVRLVCTIKKMINKC